MDGVRVQGTNGTGTEFLTYGRSVSQDWVKRESETDPSSDDYLLCEGSLDGVGPDVVSLIPTTNCATYDLERRYKVKIKLT